MQGQRSLGIDDIFGLKQLKLTSRFFLRQNKPFTCSAGFKSLSHAILTASAM